MTLVEALVRCPSVSGQEAAVAQALVRAMRGRGLSARLDEAGNAVGTLGSGPRKMYLVGHLDTVPGRWPVRVEDGVLHGRGSVDAKGALAAFVEAVATQEKPERLSLTVIGCVGEEADSPGARHVLEAYPRPDYVLVGEPSGWEGITLGYKGSLTLDYRLTKPQVHRGAPGATPAEEAVAFYNALCAAYPERGPGFERVSLRLVTFHTSSDGRDEAVEMRVNVRTPPGFDPSALRRVVAQARGEARVSADEPLPAVLADKRNALVRALLGAIRAQGGRPRFKRKTGTSDMNLFQRWGCPLLAYGPGDSSLDHTPEERLSLTEYEQAIAVLGQALCRLA